MLELVLMAPWVFFLFVGALDWGFYSSALVTMQAAARSAALRTSSGDSVLAANSLEACNIAVEEMRKLPNIGASVTCPATNPVVTATLLISGPDLKPASKVTVTYQSISLVPMPGMLAKQFRITRTVTMRLRTTT